MNSYDCIVIGVGAVGSATLAQLAARGARVLGIERFEPGHDRGSSHGHTRAIRLAYFEHPDYVPLLRRAFALWRELNERALEPLYFETGVLEAGPRDGELIEGVLRAASTHNLDLEELSVHTLARRFPGFRLPPDFRAVFEPVAGYLHVEDCIKQLAAEAVASGAHLCTNTTVESWNAVDDGFVVRSERESWHAKRLILTQGAWAAACLPTLKLEVVRKPQLWYRARDTRYRRNEGCAPFAMETSEGRVFYGFPELDERGVKIAEHTDGTPVDDPLSLDTNLHASDRGPVEAFASDYMPGLTTDCLHHVVCMYTRSADGHFIVDRHPDHADVQFAAGLSGHGFKFAPVLGEALADLALDGGTRLPIDFLSASRFSGRH